MIKISCLVDERFVSPLFEVFDGGDFVLTSYRDVEADQTEMAIYFSMPEEEESARNVLSAAMGIVGIQAEIERSEIPDEDWKLAYRRHFKVDAIGKRLLVVPEWELAEGTARAQAENRQMLVLDPGMAFGTGKHETTRTCLEFIESNSDEAQSFLDMGCGSGILSIAAAKLGYSPVEGFDVDQEAVDASIENAKKNEVNIGLRKFALGRVGKRGRKGPPGPAGKFDLVVANILGPLLIRFADEIVPYCANKLVISGILDNLYPEVLSAYEARGFEEIERRTLGEWTSGLLRLKRTEQNV